MELFCPCHSTGSLVSLQFPTTGRASKTVFFKHNLPLSHKLYNTLTIESLKGLWEKFSLLNDEENGIECTKKDALANFILTAKFLTKRIVNVELLRAPFDHCGDRRRMFRSRTWAKTFCSSILKMSVTMVVKIAFQIIGSHDFMILSHQNVQNRIRIVKIGGSYVRSCGIVQERRIVWDPTNPIKHKKFWFFFFF